MTTNCANLQATLTASGIGETVILQDIARCTGTFTRPHRRSSPWAA